MIKQDQFLEIIGTELRAARELHPSERVSAEEASSGMGWGRSALSKIEIGDMMPDGVRRRTNISLYAYLSLVERLARNMPSNHPAIAFLEHIRLHSKKKGIA